MNRRSFISTLATAGVASIPNGPLHAIEPFRRESPKFSGIGLTTYSMKPHMKWWWGKPTEGKLDMLGFLDYCAKLELEGSEITSYFFQDPLDRSYINSIKRRAQILGLDITGGAMGNNFAYAPGTEEARRELDYTRKWIDHFADMGAPVVRVFAGKKLPEGAGHDQIIENVLANLEQALSHAEKRGVVLGLENHDFVKNIDYLLRIVEAVESDWFGVIWDSANLWPVPDPYAELARIAPYAITAQIKVMTRVEGEEVPADYGRLLDILRKANFRGYIILEYEEEEDPYTAIPVEVAKLRKLL